jgi:hypothetical protein
MVILNSMLSYVGKYLKPKGMRPNVAALIQVSRPSANSLNQRPEDQT